MIRHLFLCIYMHVFFVCVHYIAKANCFSCLLLEYFLTSSSFAPNQQLSQGRTSNDVFDINISH